MDLWIWILLAAVVVMLFVVIAVTLRAIRPKAPEPLGIAPRAPIAATPHRTGGAGTAAETSPAALSPAVIAQIDALVAAEQKIRAIKVLREATGGSLQEAKTRIDRWQVSAHGASTSPAAPLSAPPRPADAVAHLDPSVRTEIGRLIAADQKIRAIKVLRDATGLGLKDSKDAVESWR